MIYLQTKKANFLKLIFNQNPYVLNCLKSFLSINYFFNKLHLWQTSLREILSNASSSSNDLIFTILHPPTNFSLNTYSISSLNIVTVLKKLDNSEWDSLKFKFKFNNEETLIEKWFLTKENVQKCIKTLDDETKWVNIILFYNLYNL